MLLCHGPLFQQLLSSFTTELDGWHSMAVQQNALFNVCLYLFSISQ